MKIKNLHQLLIEGEKSGKAKYSLTSFKKELDNKKSKKSVKKINLKQHEQKSG
jgi:hypothetical protein